MKAQFLPLFNVNISQLQLNSTSIQFQLNFDSISSQDHFNLRLESTSASISTSIITSTQYGCDRKVTQSCICYVLSIWHLLWSTPYIFFLYQLQKSPRPPPKLCWFSIGMPNGPKFYTCDIASQSDQISELKLKLKMLDKRYWSLNVKIICSLDNEN